MLNKIIRFSLHNRLLVLVAAVLLMVGGVYTTQRTEVDVFPDLNAPTVVVMTETNGMAAEEVEQLVTFPIETAVNGATDVRRVRSSSSAGLSVVWVEFDWDTDIYRARQIVSEKLAAVQNDLPEGVGQPTLGPQSSILGEVLIVSLTADSSTSMLDLRTLADWTIRPRLLQAGGVAQVSVLGGDVKEYQILLHPEKMRHYNVSLSEVLEATSGMNLNANGGVFYEYGNEYIVRGMAAARNIAEMGESVIKADSGALPVVLSDVADVRVGAQQPRLGLASERGKPAVLLTVTKQPNTGTIELTQRLEAALKDLQRNLPSDVKVSTDVFRQSRFIEASIHNVEKSLYEGAIFVVIVLLLFLANVRTTLISLVTLPLSLLISLMVLHVMGQSINTMSLGGLAIAIGSLVDDAIVDVENVWKHLRLNHTLPSEQRQPVLKVVYEASREVRMPILNSTLIIIVSFLPLFCLSGMEGRMLVPLGVAFIVALLASTVVALTLTPVLCSYLPVQRRSGAVAREAAVASWLKKHYRTALVWTLGHKRIVVGTTASLLVVAVGVFFTLGHSFLPPFNEGSLTINVSSLPGISLEESDEIGRQAEKLLLSIPEIKTVARKTGRAELDEHALGVNVSEIEAPFELNQGRTHQELLDEVRHKLAAIKGANIEIGQPISHRIDAMLSGTQASIAIKLFGDDLNRMFELGNQIKQAISTVDGIADLNVEQQVERPELTISPKRQMLAMYGIKLTDFTSFVRAYLGGEVVSQVYEDGKSFNLVVRATESHRNTAERIRDLMIDCPDGRKVALSEVADVRSTTGPNTINRENVRRKIVISANANGRDLLGVVTDIQRRIDAQIKLPEGYHIEYGGQFESQQRAGRILLLASVVCVIAIFLLLYMQFRNALEGAVVLLNLPLALIGGVLILKITTGEVSIPAVIGFISLFGIATRGGMLLISRYGTLRQEQSGISIRECVIEGSLDRLNPILMTALCSALALIPLAINDDVPGNEIQSPMAKVILGGLLTSTFLNAFIIPIVYEWLHRSAEHGASIRPHSSTSLKV